RVRRKGRAVLRSPVDLAVAGVAVVGLALALLLRGGGSRVGSVGLGVIDPVREAVSHPMWVPFLLFKLAFASAFLLVVALPLSLRLRDALRAPRTERADALWLAVLLPILATGVFTASFLITEKRGPIDIVPKVAEAFGVGLWTGFKELTYNLALLVDFDNVRYLTPALVPFLWLLLPHVAFESDVPRDPEIEGARVRRRHERLFVAAAALYAAVLLFNPITGLRIPSEGRVWAFFLMALVPLAVALVARSQRYDVAERRAGGTTTRRYVEAKPPPIRWRPVLLLALAGLALAYLGSLWYAIVLVGLAVALASQSRRGAVVAMALFLLCASAVQYRSPFPAEEASAWLAETLPPGTVIGAAEPIVYFAAVAPDGMPLRLVDPANPPPDVQAMVIPGGRGYGEYPNFTAAAAWDYDFSFSPPLEWRLAVERDVLGNPIALEKQRGITVFVRNGTLPAQP
ncbi:MAG TPA: hypothetical protein VHH36_04965, partial [Candidatus Thermoplasmatota archaeon]|nr:hypothetical protein [Candidatus Thermoplasmatota archaeon]